MFSRKVFHACAVVNNIYLLRINIENFNDIFFGVFANSYNSIGTCYNLFFMTYCDICICYILWKFFVDHIVYSNNVWVFSNII